MNASNSNKDIVILPRCEYEALLTELRILRKLKEKK